MRKLLTVMIVLMLCLVPSLAFDRGQMLWQTYDSVANNTVWYYNHTQNVTVSRNYCSYFYQDGTASLSVASTGKDVIGMRAVEQENYPSYNAPARNFALFLKADTNLTGLSFPTTDGIHSYYAGSGYGNCNLAYSSDLIPPAFVMSVYVNGTLRGTTSRFNCTDNITGSLTHDCVIDFANPPVGAEVFGNLSGVFPAGSEIKITTDVCYRAGERCFYVVPDDGATAWWMFANLRGEVSQYNGTMDGATSTWSSPTYGDLNLTCNRSGAGAYGGTINQTEWWVSSYNSVNYTGYGWQMPYDACGLQRHDNIVDFGISPVTYRYWSVMWSNSTGMVTSLAPYSVECGNKWFSKYVTPLINWYGTKMSDDKVVKVMQINPTAGYDMMGQCVSSGTTPITTTTISDCDLLLKTNGTEYEQMGGQFGRFLCVVSPPALSILLGVLLATIIGLVIWVGMYALKRFAK